jgi:hypothetical protein
MQPLRLGHYYLPALQRRSILLDAFESLAPISAAAAMQSYSSQMKLINRVLHVFDIRPLKAQGVCAPAAASIVTCLPKP